MLFISMTLLPDMNGAPLWMPAERAVTAIACTADGDGGDGCVCARVFARVCARVRTRVRACVYARVRVYMRDVFAIYDNIFDPG